MHMFAKVVVRLDQGPWCSILRVALGYGIARLWWGLWGADGSVWTLGLAVLVTLIALRIGPMVFRKMFRFDDAARATWAHRRQLAKRFDSYQWQKLFWIGLGLGLYGYLSGRRLEPLIRVTWFVLGCGAIGQLVWLYRSAQLRRVVPVPARPVPQPQVQPHGHVSNVGSDS